MGIFSHLSKMIRVGLFLALILAGAPAAPKAAKSLRQDFTEEDVEAILDMVFCACDEGDRDGVLSLDEFTSEVCEVVNNHLFDYQVNAQDFENLDSNDDGQLSTAEVFGAFNAMFNSKSRSNSLKLFSNNEYIEAGVRVLGCACDSDESMSLSWEEVSTEECVFVQNWVFEEHLDENAFDMVDANGDGFLQGCEVAVALEDFFA